MHEPLDLADDAGVIARIQTRVSRITTLTRWYDRCTERLTRTERDLQDARQLIVLQQRLLSQQAGDPADLPPATLVDAWHSPGDRLVTVDIDGVPVTLVVTGGHPPDPAREAREWQQLKAAYRAVRDDVRRPA